MARQTFVIKPQEDVGPEVASGDDENIELLTITEEPNLLPHFDICCVFRQHLLLFIIHLLRPLLFLIEKE